MICANRLIGVLKALTCAATAAGAAPRTDALPVIGDGGRTRANVLTRMAVPEPPADGETVLIEILDPSGQPMWRGASTGPTFGFLPLDWADGVYTVRFRPGGEQTVRVATEEIERIRARCGLMLRELEHRRDADGLVPPELAGASNLLQRVMTLWLWDQSPQQAAGHLAFCEQQLKLKTDTATVRILGSGASDYLGYDGAYRPGVRERSMMFMPPDAVVDFAANGERKLDRWGYRERDVAHVFISHAHADHFDAKAIADFAEKRRQAGPERLTVHAGRAACEQLRKHLTETGREHCLALDELAPGAETRAGDITARAVRATHAADSSPLCYILRYRGATVYYGTDSGYPCAETYAALAEEKFDVFATECTVASADDGVTHQDLGDMLLLVGRLRADGAINPWTRVVSIHQSPAGPQSLRDRDHWQRQIGFTCSFDGMPLAIAFRLAP